MSISDYIQEYAMYNINDDAFHYRMDLKIDNTLHTLSYVFRGDDPTPFDDVRFSFIEYLENLAVEAKTVEKPRSNGGLMFANIEKMRARYPS